MSQSQRPTLQQLQETAENLGFEWDKDFSEEVKKLTEVIEEAMECTDFYEDVVDRHIGRAPVVGENENNQWVWKCDIKRREEVTGGKLDGKRVAIKDCISVANIPMDVGNAGLSGFVPREDAVVVKKILEQGGTIVGKTNCENLCYSASSVTSCHGTVSNPLDPTRISGGSSSGNAVALARGEVNLAVGTDSGCSVRVPASLCGCVGMKPTFGLIPTTGVVPCIPSLDHIGPMADTVQDCALLLEVLAECRDTLIPASNVKRDYTSQINDSISGLRVGLIEQCLRSGPECDQVTETVMQMVHQLKDFEKVLVKKVSIPSYHEALKITDILSVLEYHEVVNHGTQPYRGRHYAISDIIPAGVGVYKHQDRDGQAASVCTAVYSDSIQKSFLLQRTINRMHPVLREVESVFEQCDVLITATAPQLAPKLQTMNPVKKGRTTKIRMNTNTCMFNVTGHPAISVTCGFAKPTDSEIYLPVGMQIVGRFYEEATILRVARAVEKIRMSQNTILAKSNSPLF